MGKLEHKVAIVTGAARGIGLAIAKRFVAEDAKVVIADVLEREGAIEAKHLGKAAHFVPCDVGDARQVAEMVEAACRTGDDCDFVLEFTHPFLQRVQL